MTTAPPPRDKDEAIRDLDYGIRLSQRHYRLYNRLHASMRFIELLGGSVAVGVAVSGSPGLLKLAGGLVAAVACANFAFEPGSVAREHQRVGRELTKVRAKVAKLTWQQIDKQRAEVIEPSYIEGLRDPAWNDMMRSHGFASSAKRLSLWQRFMAAIA